MTSVPTHRTTRPCTLVSLGLAALCAVSTARASPAPDSPAGPTTTGERVYSADARPGESLLMFDMTASSVTSGLETGGPIGIGGVQVSYAQRSAPWLTTALRAGVHEADGGFGGSFQAAVDIDPEWKVAPIVGVWLGYRGTVADLVPDRATDPITIGAHDALLGVELGARLRDGPVMVGLLAQWSTAALAARTVSGLVAPDVSAPSFGETAQFTVAVTAGLRW